MIHDKTLIERRFARALVRYNTMAVVQLRIAQTLAQLIPQGTPRVGVEIGAGSGFLTNRLIEKFPTTHWIANDITPKSQEFMPSGIEFRAQDGETMELPQGLDLLATASTIQWFDNLPLFILRAHQALSPSGIIAFSTFGKENFREIQNSLDYHTMEQLQEILRTVGFTILSSREWTQQMHFDTPLEVLRHIKATGVNAISNNPWGPSQLQQFIRHYPTPATLTFHPIIIIARKQATPPTK